MFFKTNWSSKWVYEFTFLSVLFLGILLPTTARACTAEFTAQARIEPDRIVAEFQPDEANFETTCLTAEAHRRLGQNDQALEFFEMAVSFSPDRKTRARTLTNVGAIQGRIGDMLEARETFEEALNISREEGDLRNISRTMNSLAGVYAQLGRQRLAVESLTEAIDIAKELYVTEPEESLRMGIVMMHHNGTNLLLRSGDIPAARELYDGDTEYIRETDPPFIFTFRKQLEGEFAYNTGNYEQARVMLEEALEQSENMERGTFPIYLFYRLALTYDQLGDIEGLNEMAVRSRTEVQKSETISLKERALVEEIEARSLRLSGDTGSALDTYETALSTLSEFYELNSEASLTRLDALYGKRAQDNKIELLEVQNRASESTLRVQQILLGGAVALSLMSMLALFLYYTRRREREKMTSKIAQAYAVTEERTRIARELHDTLIQDVTGASLKMQRALNHIGKTPALAKSVLAEAMDDADAAVTRARYVILEGRLPSAPNLNSILTSIVARRQPGAELRYVLSLADADLIPAMDSDILAEAEAIVQELCQNSERHAKATEIEISLTRAEREVVLTVADNGTGFDPKVTKENHFGLVGVKERAKAIGAKFELLSSKQGGTVANLRFLDK